MKSLTSLFLAALALANLNAEQVEQAAPLGPSKVDMAGFLEETAEAATYRSDRLVELEEFKRLAALEDTIILDTRSQAAYEQKHLAGSIHLNFSDFTADNLAALIPSKSTRILIYCNNNIEADPKNFAQKKPPLALNIPTFVNLYGYGYRNVYELASFVPVGDPRLEFEGADVL